MISPGNYTLKQGVPKYENAEGYEWMDNADRYYSDLEVVMAHEMGHSTDDQYRPADPRYPEYAPDNSIWASGAPWNQELWNSNKQYLRDYGSTNPQEGYAEAYAAWILGGEAAKSNPAVAAYAEYYGWEKPRRQEGYA
jgi:hypothetical protein